MVVGTENKLHFDSHLLYFDFLRVGKCVDNGFSDGEYVKL